MHPTRSTPPASGIAATLDAASWATALPLVAILRGIEPHESAAHAAALLDSGFDCIEVPTNSPSWADSVRTIADLAAGRALVGAGTVLTAAHLDALVAAGGRMSVSPHTDPTLIHDSIPLGRYGTMEEIASAIGFLCLPMAGYVNEQCWRWPAGSMQPG